MSAAQDTDPGTLAVPAAARPRRRFRLSSRAVSGLQVTPLAIILIGLGTWVVGMFALGIWAIYRVARGWLALKDGKPLPAT